MQHWVHLLVQDPDNKDIELSNSIKNGVFLMIMTTYARTKFGTISTNEWCL